jgi:hypothetical protein
MEGICYTYPYNDKFDYKLNNRSSWDMSFHTYALSSPNTTMIGTNICQSQNLPSTTTCQQREIHNIPYYTTNMHTYPTRLSHLLHRTMFPGMLQHTLVGGKQTWTPLLHHYQTAIHSLLKKKVSIDKRA